MKVISSNERAEQDNTGIYNMQNKLGFKVMGVALATVIALGLFGSASSANAAVDTQATTPAATAPATTKGIHLDKLVWDALVDSSLKATGLTKKQLRDAITDDKSLADVLRGLGDNVTAIEDAAKASVRSHIDQLVADGTLTRARADKLLKRLDTLSDKLINRKGWGHHKGTPTPQPTLQVTPTGTPSIQ